MDRDRKIECPICHRRIGTQTRNDITKLARHQPTEPSPARTGRVERTGVLKPRCGGSGMAIAR